MNGRLTGIAILISLALVACSQGPPVGTAAPAFSAVDAHGNAVSLAAYDDKVLILDFWAVW